LASHQNYENSCRKICSLLRRSPLLFSQPSNLKILSHIHAIPIILGKGSYKTTYACYDIATHTILAYYELGSDNDHKTKLIRKEIIRTYKAFGLGLHSFRGVCSFYSLNKDNEGILRLTMPYYNRGDLLACASQLTSTHIKNIIEDILHALQLIHSNLNSRQLITRLAGIQGAYCAEFLSFTITCLPKKISVSAAIFS
ncbi:MAG: hypothetical protein ACQEP8_06735, partial [Chlamydiota bacterium]